MSASLCGNMRGHWVKTTLLLLLLTSLTGTVFCEDDEPTDPPPESDGDAAISDAEPTTNSEPTDPGPGESNSTYEFAESSGQEEISQTAEEDIITARVASNQYITNPTDGNTFDTDNSTSEGETEEDNPNMIIIIAAVLAVVLLCMIVAGVLVWWQRNKKEKNQEMSKEDPYLDESSTEKVPMPMFEEDVPSVQELEMEELDQWMKKDSSSTPS